MSRSCLFGAMLLVCSASSGGWAAAPQADDGMICSTAADIPGYAGPDVPGALSLPVSDGYHLQAAIVVPKGAPKALVVIIAGAWFGRDDAMVELSAQLAARGVASARFRQRCHSKYPALETYKDIDAVLAAAQGKVPKATPLYLLGHSRGAWYIMRGIVRGLYKPDGVVFIAGGHDDWGHYNGVIRSAKAKADKLKAGLSRLDSLGEGDPQAGTVLKDLNVKSKEELELRSKEAETAWKDTVVYFEKLERGELKDTDTIPGDKGGGEGFPPTTAALFRDENELKDPEYQREFIKTGTPSLLLVGSGDRPDLKADFKRFAGKFPPGTALNEVLDGFDHTLRDAGLHVPAVLPDTIADWISGRLTPDQKRRAEQFTSLFENSTIEFQYGYGEALGDGRGLTMGRIGFTTSEGEVAAVVELYGRRRPGSALTAFLPRLRALGQAHSAGTSGLKGFLGAWAAAARDPGFRAVQDELVDRFDYGPAMRLAGAIGLKTALAKAVLYDSVVQNGGGDDPDGVPALMERARIAAGGTPAAGVDEGLWLRAFLRARHDDLDHPAEAKTRGAWRGSSQRCDAFQAIADSGNFSLAGPIPIATPDFQGTIP